MSALASSIRSLAPSGGTVAAVAALAAATVLLFPGSAWAISVKEVFTNSPIVVIGIILTEFCVYLVKDCLAPIIQVGFQWSTDYLTIPYVNTLILFLQGFAAAAVICVRVAYGVKIVLGAEGDVQNFSVAKYFFDSIGALVLVALMPMICRTIIQLGSTMYNDIAADGGDLKELVGWFTLGDNFTWGAGVDPDAVSATLWIVLGTVLMMVLCIAASYQFIMRQVHMLAISIVAPLVSIFAGSDDNRFQVWAILRQLFALTCVQWLQYVLVCVALNFGISWIQQTVQSGEVVGAFADEDGVKMFMLCIATFMAALTVPNFVDQYTGGAGGGSRVGAMAAGIAAGGAVRGAIGGAGKAVGGAAGLAGKGAGAALRAGGRALAPAARGAKGSVTSAAGKGAGQQPGSGPAKPQVPGPGTSSGTASAAAPPQSAGKAAAAPSSASAGGRSSSSGGSTAHRSQPAAQPQQAAQQASGHQTDPKPLRGQGTTGAAAPSKQTVSRPTEAQLKRYIRTGRDGGGK